MRKLLLSFILSLMTFTSHAQNYLLGDVNSDGKVTVADAMMVVNIILNGYTTFSVNPTAVTITAGGTTTIDIEGGYNQYEITSSNTDVVTATLNGSTVTLTAIANGEATVTVKDVLTLRFVEILVTVEDNQPQSYLTCPDDLHPHLIDLGLPSGTKWACCNLDIDHPEKQSPTNHGGYYAWGETETKTTYDWSTYIHCDGSSSTCHDLGSDIAGTQYDVAHVKWGGSWVMPSLAQIEELLNNCTYEWTTRNGVEGGEFTNKKNGASIFLPVTGYHWSDYLIADGKNGYCWSSTQSPSNSSDAYCLLIKSGDVYWYDTYHHYGHSIRPVSR